MSSSATTQGRAGRAVSRRRASPAGVSVWRRRCPSTICVRKVTEPIEPAVFHVSGPQSVQRIPISDGDGALDASALLGVAPHCCRCRRPWAAWCCSGAPPCVRRSVVLDTRVWWIQVSHLLTGTRRDQARREPHPGRHIDAERVRALDIAREKGSVSEPLSIFNASDCRDA